MNYSDPYGRQPRKVNAGFTVGLVGAGIMAAISLVAMLIFRFNALGDWITWGIQLLVYIFISQSAAQRQYDSQERDPDALRGVRGAGAGAAITVSLSMWLFIFVRDIILSSMHMLVLLEPFSTFCRVVIDVLLAIGLGTWGGSIVEKKYKGFEGYNSKDL